MERAGLGGMGGKPVDAILVVKAAVLAGFLAVLGMGCTDPFSPVEPQSPTAQVSLKGSDLASEVPADLFGALDSGQVGRIGVLISDSTTFESNGQTLSRSRLYSCATELATLPSRSTSILGTPSELSLGTDSVVERFTYSVYRTGSRIARATATWTVIRTGTEWKLQHWSETAQDSGWFQLCRSPR